MATIPVQRIMQVTEYSDHHGTLATEAANQTFKRGNFIAPDASGKMAAVAAGAITAKVKLAAQDAENAATPRRNNLSKVNPTATMIFEVTALGTGTAALLAAGKKYGYSIDATSGFGVLNLADTTNAAFELINHDGDTLAPGSNATDVNPRVYARLVNAIIN